MTSAIVILINIFLFFLNLHMIRDGYHHAHYGNPNDGQYGMVYGIYIFVHVLNIIINLILGSILLVRKKTQKKQTFQIALYFILFNILLISIGWAFL